jgi:hypothetical protein
VRARLAISSLKRTLKKSLKARVRRPMRSFRGRLVGTANLTRRGGGGKRVRTGVQVCRGFQFGGGAAHKRAGG